MTTDVIFITLRHNANRRPLQICRHCGDSAWAVSHTCKARNADELEVVVVAYLKDYYAKGDFDAMAAEIFKVYKESSGSKESEAGNLFR